MSKVSEVEASAGAIAPDPSAELGAATRLVRLRQAVELAGGLTAVARLSGVPLSTLQRYMSGGEMKFGNAASVSEACGVRLEWLATGKGAMRLTDPTAGGGEGTAEPAKSGPFHLFPTANMDRLAAAYAAARGLLAQRGIHTPDPLDLVRIMCVIYDELTDAEEKPRTA